LRSFENKGFQKIAVPQFLIGLLFAILAFARIAKHWVQAQPAAVRAGRPPGEGIKHLIPIFDAHRQ
jgi:hypothetical protein